MAKAPAFQFYVKDWLADVELQSASASTRGIWINALCLMWESRTRGTISFPKSSGPRFLNCQPAEFELFLREASVTKFADVTLCNGVVTLSNRRMVAEEKVRSQTKLRVQRHRSNAPCNADKTLPSSSPTPCTKVQEEPPIPPGGVASGFPQVASSDPEPEQIFDPEDTPSIEFEQFFDAYPKQVDKAKAWNVWRKLGRANPGLASLLAAIVEQSQSDQWTRDHGRYIPNAAKWLAERKWQDKLSPAPTSPASGQTSDSDWKRYAGSCIKEPTQ